MKILPCAAALAALLALTACHKHEEKRAVDVVEEAQAKAIANAPAAEKLDLPVTAAPASDEANKDKDDAASADKKDADSAKKEDAEKKDDAKDVKKDESSDNKAAAKDDKKPDAKP